MKRTMNTETIIAAVMSKDLKKMVVAKLEEITGQKAKWNPVPKLYHTVGEIKVTKKEITFPADTEKKHYDEFIKFLDEIELPYMMVDTEITLSENDKMVEVEIEKENETMNEYVDKEIKFDIEQEINEFTQPIGEKKEEKKEKKEKKPSTAKIVNEMIMKVLTGPKSAEAFEVLTDQAKCHELLKIRYAFLKEVTKSHEDRKINGFARYAKKTIEYNGKEFWTCNDLYKRNIAAVEAWAKTMK